MLKIPLISLVILNVSCSSSKPETPVQPEKKPDLIRKALVDNVSKFQNCYSIELDGRMNTMSGEVIFDFIVNANGLSEDVKVKSREKISQELAQCLKNVVGTVQFPITSAGALNTSQSFQFFPNRR